MKRNYYIAINDYRSSTDNGSQNPCYSTMGIRMATPAERARAARELATYGDAAVPII